MRRIERALQSNLLTRTLAAPCRQPLPVPECRLTFFPVHRSNIVGRPPPRCWSGRGTGCQHCQVTRRSPHGCQPNARGLWGTADVRTLLAANWHSTGAETEDGIQRCSGLQRRVGQEVPAYGFCNAQVPAGTHHPLVRTQFFSEEIDARRLFTASACNKRAPPGAGQPAPGCVYALLIDLAGDESSRNPDMRGWRIRTGCDRLYVVQWMTQMDDCTQATYRV